MQSLKILTFPCWCVSSTCTGSCCLSDFAFDQEGKRTISKQDDFFYWGCLRRRFAWGARGRHTATSPALIPTEPARIFAKLVLGRQNEKNKLIWKGTRSFPCGWIMEVINSSNPLRNNVGAIWGPDELQINVFGEFGWTGKKEKKSRDLNVRASNK